jgi:hypothetical protein
MNFVAKTPLVLGVVAISFALSPGVEANSNHLDNIKLKASPQSIQLPYKQFTHRDVVTAAPMSGSAIELFDGRIVPLNQYLLELNGIERELNSFGMTLRSQNDNLGIVAYSATPQPVLINNLPEKNSSNHETRWSHQISHELASVNSAGQITQRERSSSDTEIEFDRTTSHSVSGRFLSAQSPSIAQIVQRVVHMNDGTEQKETQIYVNGKQVFRRGRIDEQEGRIWSTAFDVPFKSITVPVGPATLEAKIGVRGSVNLDLELNPGRSNAAAPEYSMAFKPHVLADGYVTTKTSPTNVGDAGLEGAITLTKNTLDINGVAALTRGFKIEVKEITVDNLFEGFNGRIFGYANVTIPGKKGSDGNKKRFEKEFYSWNGVKVEQRIYEYKAPVPQPPAL